MLRVFSENIQIGVLQLQEGRLLATSDRETLMIKPITFFEEGDTEGKRGYISRYDVAYTKDECIIMEGVVVTFL